MQGERELTIQDVNLSCYYPQETIVEREVNCNSQFMLRILPQISHEIRQPITGSHPKIEFTWWWIMPEGMEQEKQGRSAQGDC